MCSPTRRATTSVGPPAANGTMTVIGLFGYWASRGRAQQREREQAAHGQAIVSHRISDVSSLDHDAAIGTGMIALPAGVRASGASSAERHRCVGHFDAADRRRSRRCGPATLGPAVQWAIEHQIKVGRLSRRRGFRAGSAGPHHGRHRVARRRRRRMARTHGASCRASERRVRIPTITDPRGTDFAAAQRLKHQPWMLDLERRAIAAFEALGVLMTDTCINYQTIMPPVRGEHCRLWRHRRGDLFEQRVRRALEFRGRAVGAERRPDRPHAALRLSSRRAAAGHARRRRRPGRRASSTTGARSAASSAASPATTGRCRRSSASTACPAPTR